MQRGASQLQVSPGGVVYTAVRQEYRQIDTSTTAAVVALLNQHRLGKLLVGGQLFGPENVREAVVVSQTVCCCVRLKHQLEQRGFDEAGRP